MTSIGPAATKTALMFPQEFPFGIGERLKSLDGRRRGRVGWSLSPVAGASRAAETIGASRVAETIGAWRLTLGEVTTRARGCGIESIGSALITRGQCFFDT